MWLISRFRIIGLNNSPLPAGASPIPNHQQALGQTGWNQFYFDIVFFFLIILSSPASVSNGQLVQNAASNQASRQPVGEPLFVAVPPRPQRLLHSEAYIK